MLDKNLILESYYEIQEELKNLSEASSTEMYLNHHSTFGDIFASPVLSLTNTKLKQNNFKQLRKLYPKYVKYCNKQGFKPLPEKDFVREARKFYAYKEKNDLVRTGINGGTDLASSIARQAGMDTLAGGIELVGGTANITTAISRRGESFSKKAGMIDDIED